MPMNPQDNLVDFIRRKGVGKTMSKSLTPSECQQVIPLLQDDSIESATKTTLLVAFLMLSNTSDEQRCIDTIKSNYEAATPEDCHFLFDSSLDIKNTMLIECIHTILNKQNLTKCK